MSHTSTYKHKIKDVNLFVNLATSLGYEVRTQKNVIVYHFTRQARIEAAAAIKLPGWKYEIAIKKDGEILYDHWGSEASSFERLGYLIQAYNKQIITEAIPYSEIKNLTNTLEINGDVKMVLEYA